MTLSVELFNRPSDEGRVDSVLILLNHAFEMLLKASIVERGGRIRKPRAEHTLGFDECVRKAYSDGEVRFIDEDQVLLLQAINGLRNAAQHHLLDLNEQLLYVNAQAGVTLFGDILQSVFSRELRELLPERVLPLSVVPPLDLETLFSTEVEQVKSLLAPGKRRRTEAHARLRALSILDSALQGSATQPSDRDLRDIATSISEGKTWDSIFSGVAAIELAPEGSGPTLALRITKREGVPIRLVREGEPGALVVGVRRVNELDYYSLGRNDIAEKIGLTQPKTSALIWHLDIQSTDDYFREIRIGASIHQRYSMSALDCLHKAAESEDIESIWKAYRARKDAAA